MDEIARRSAPPAGKQERFSGRGVQGLNPNPPRLRPLYPRAARVGETWVRMRPNDHLAELE